MHVYVLAFPGDYTLVQGLWAIPAATQALGASGTREQRAAHLLYKAHQGFAGGLEQLHTTAQLAICKLLDCNTGLGIL